MLGDSIDASGKNFDPIASLAGGINGLGHNIDNLNINLGTETNVGLVSQGAASGSYFKNLSFNNANIVGRNNVGTLIGLTNNSYIDNINIEANVRSSGNNRFQIGGLAG